MRSRYFLGIHLSVFLFVSAAGLEAGQIAFLTDVGPGDSVDFAGVGALVGLDINIINIVGIGTPSNDGVTATCSDCTLDFGTGALSGSDATHWFFVPGGSFTIQGGVDFGGAPGLEIPLGSSLGTGSFGTSEVELLRNDVGFFVARITADVSITYNPTVAAFYGLDVGPFAGTFIQTIEGSGNPLPPDAFSSRTVVGLLQNDAAAAISLPGTIWLLGLGLLAGVKRRR